MAVFKATKNKSDSEGKFKATEKRSYDTTMVYDWEARNKESMNVLEQYRKKVNNGGYLSADDLEAYRKALDSYVETSNSLRSIAKVFGQGDMDDDKSWRSAIGALKENYNSVSKYYSQFASEKDYNDFQIGWLNPDAETNEETVAARKDRFESNASRIEEIKKELPWYGDTFLPSAIENIFLSDEHDALKSEMEMLESENRQYQRTQGVLDQYYTPVTEEFQQNAGYRDYSNASKEELWAYDMSAIEGSTALSNGGYFDEAGNIYDAKGNLVQSAIAPQVTDKLGMFLSASDAEITEAYNRLLAANGNHTDTWANLMREGDLNSWKYLTEHEINIYYDLYKREGHEAAYKFLSDMTTELNRRETQKTQEYINSAPLLEQIFLNVASIPMNVFGGATAFAEDTVNVLQGNDINPYSKAHAFQNAASAIRSDTARDINNLTGNAALPFVGTTFGDVYQSIMSFGDSAAASFIPSGHVLLGMNAASTEMKDLYERGGSAEQIFAGGILAGAAEMFFEKYSMGELQKIKNMDTKAVKTFTDGFVRAMVMGGVEASEEMATEIANTISDALVMGSRTDWVDMGTFVKNVVNAGIGGFISGGLGGGIAAKMNNAQYNQQVTKHGQSIIDKGGVDALQQLAMEMSGSNKAIGKLSNKVSAKATAKNVGKLSDLMGDTTMAQNHADITKALEEKGLSKKDAKRVAEYLNKASQGEYFTEQEAAEAMSNKKIAEVLRDVIADPKSSVNDRTIKLADARLGKTSRTEQTHQGEEIVSSEGNLTVQEESVPESHYEVSEDGQMVNTKTGDTIEPQGLAQAEDGTYRIAVKDADPVSNSDVSYADNNQALVYETFVNLEGKYGKTNKVIASMDLDSRNALLGLYNYEINKDGGIFANGAVSAFFYGHQGIDLSAVPKTSPVWQLTEQQRKIAWNQGRIAGVKATDVAQSNVDTTYEEAQKVLKQTGVKKGSYHAVLEEGITPMQLNEKQKAVYRLADDIAQGVQTNIHVYEGENKEQGLYDHKTDEIWLNLNAANTSREAIMAFTLAHELVHRAKKGSPVKYKAFVEFLMKEYGKQGTDVDALIAEQMAAAKAFNKTVPKAKRINMTKEKAFEEVVCDACQRMLLDTNAGQKLAEFGAQSKENKGFLEDLKRWISELLERLRNYFKGVDPDSKAAKEFAKFDENVKQILADMFVDMSIDAGEKLSTIKAAYGDAFASKFLGLKDVQYNLAAVETHKDKLQKEYSEDSSTDLETIMKRYDKIIDIWNRLGGELNSKFLADWNSKMGKDRTFTIFKAQAGYKYNVELSSMCKKGVPLFEAIDTIVKQEVMKELGLSVLGKAEKEILYDILKQHHFEIPCAICYVEQARQREGVIIDAFLNGKVEKNAKGEITKVKLGWNQVLDSIQKEMKANGVDYSFAEVSRDIATEKYTPANLDMDMKTQVAFYAALKKIANQEIARYNKAEGKSRKLLTDVTPEAVKECFKGTLPANLKIFKVLFEEPSSRFKFKSDLLYSSVATQNLSMAHNKLYGLFNSQGGVSGYKTKQGTTIYWGDILGKSWKPDTLRNEGGVRNQSNSDFQMYTLLDQAQMYLDFTAKGYYLQAYTKVLSELKLFGLSRGKINASLIPRVIEYRNADGSVDVERTMATAGLDENGNPIYDDIEGINHNEAFMLIEDPEYSKSICGICIGYSDAHINKLLDDSRVQQIIGFHDKTDDGSKRYKGARYAKNYNGLNEAVNKEGKTVHIGFNPYVKKAEKKFKFNAETETFEGTVNYNGKTYTADDIPRLAADLYLEMCAKKEHTPAYDDFKGHPNYYKLLADFGLYDSQGHYAPHRKVVYNMPDTVPYLDANGKKQTMKTADYIKIELEKELAVRDSISEALADTSSEGIIPQFKAAVKKSQVENSQEEKSFSLPKGEPAPTFYSHMARVVDGVKQEKLGAASVVSMLRGKGVKAEEIKWSGIEAWLEGKKSVTKAELQEFIAGSMLQIEEEILDNKDRPYTDDQQKRLDEYEAKQDEVAKRLADEWKKLTGEEFPIRNAGAGLESSVVNKIIDANREHKAASFEGRLLAKLRKDLEKVIANNDDFGFDSWKDALRSIHRNRRDFIKSYEMSANDKAVIVKYCNALNAYNELPNKISDADTERLRDIARETEPWTRKIMEVKHEYNEESAKYMTNWGQYRLEGGKNYREMLFRIPGSTYTNEAMFTHWKERKGVLAHARVQDMDTFIGKMLFIEEIQSDWHNAGHKDGYRDPGLEDKHTLSKKMEKYTEEFYASPIADVVRERIAPIGYEGAGVSMILNFLMDSQESMESTLNTLSRKGASFTENEVSEIAKYAREYEEMYHKWETAPGDLTAPDAPFKDTYHEYVLKRLLREAAEKDYDSIGWTTAETQDERWQNNLPHKEGTGKSGFLEAYRNVYDRRMKKFLSDFGKKWGTTVGKTVLDNGTEVWSMAITDSMKESVLYDGQVVYSLPKVAESPSYEELTSKDPIPVIDIGRNDAGLSYAELKEIVLRNARERKVFDVPHLNQDTRVSIFLTDKSFTHAFSNLTADFGVDTILAMDHITEIIHAAVLTHIAAPRNSAKAENRVFTFFAAAKGENGVEPIKLTVKEYSEQNLDRIPENIRKYFQENGTPETHSRLYDAVALEVIAIESTKKESGASASGTNRKPRLVAKGTPNSTIKIADLLGLVNGDARKYIPLPATADVGYHAGDLGKAEFLHQQGYGRGTGHFGTGTYFVGNKAKIEEDEIYASRPHHAVDFKDYNLYKIRNDKDGYALHSSLRVIDGGFSKEFLDAAVADKFSVSDLRHKAHKLTESYDTKEWNEELDMSFSSDYIGSSIRAYTEVARDNGVEVQSYDAWLAEWGEDVPKPGDSDYESYRYEYHDYLKETIEQADKERNNGYPEFRDAYFDLWLRFGIKNVESALRKTLAYQNSFSDAEISAMRKDTGVDSLATVFMKNLGYEGIDVRGTGLDNTGYGSVVYDLREDSVIYKLPIGEDTSPRALLANAFEGIITNDIEKRKIQEYKGKVDMLNSEEQKLHELRAQIKELSFAKGPRDTKKIKDLQFDAVQTANRIATLDKMLLGLEASAPLQNILKREKEMAYKRAEQKGKEALEAYKKAEREKDQKWQNEVKEKYLASKKKAIETREKREAREKLQKLVLDTVKWISYPTKTDVKCPDILKQPYADFLNGIDLSSNRQANGGDPTKNDLRLANAMGSLATALDKIMTSQDPTQVVDKVLDAGYLDLPADFVQKLRDMTENIKSMMVDGDYVVNTMSAAEVRQLSQMIRTLNHAIKTMSNLYANLRFANVEALGFDTMEFMDALGEIEKTGGMKEFVQWDNALPYYAFKRFGKGGESIFEGLMDAQDKLAYLAQEIFNFRDKAWTDKEAKAWSEDTHTIDLPNGNTLTLTTADAMSIYCLSRREQGLQHLLGGGTRVLGLQEGSKKAKDSRSLLTIKDIDAINSSLTDRQKQVAEAIQEFMSTVCSEWGNEVSMKRFLTKEFTEKFYFPIESNDENLPVKDPAAQQSDLFRLLNISATKPLTPGANNEVIIRNIFDVFTGHASDMARLNAYGMALLDYMKWLNYREKAANEEGQIKVRGVRKSMQKAYGDAAMGYVLNLVKDVNGRASDGGDPNILMKWMRAAKTASVGNSLRVAHLQLTSYPRAALVLSPESLALGLTKIPNINRAKKYCGIALWKSFGFYDTNISRSIEDQMKGVTNVKQKLIELSLKGAEWGDAITWGALWNACEYEVAKTTKNKVGSEEFYQEVGKKLREVVYRTQVVDSTLTRSQIMRSKRGMAQEAAAFMSEPTLSANILMDAGFEFNMEKRRTGSAKAAWKKTGSYIGKAVAVYSIGQLAAALIESLWDAWRDEEDEEFGKKYLDAFIENLTLDLVPFNKIPIVSDVFEGALSLVGVGYYSSDKMSSTWLTQAVSAVDAWKKVLSGESSSTVYNALYKSIRALSSYYGVAFSGLMREGVALWNNTAGDYDITWKIRTWDLSKTDLGNHLYDAIVSGNERQAESIRNEFRERADNEKEYESSINSAIRKALRENDPRIKAAAQAVVDGKASERAKIAKEIEAEGHFSLQDIQAAINAEIDKIRKEAKG